MGTTQSPAHVKDHERITLHREGLTGVDSAIATINKLNGMNMAGYEEAIVEVHPTGGANPSFEVFFFSEVAGEFIREETQQTFGAEGANVRYSALVACKHRRMFIRLSAISSGTVDVRVAGHRNVIESV